MTILPSLLGRWLPDHRQRGAYWLAANAKRKDLPYGSLVVWWRSGAWKHYAADKGGGDPISLYAYLRGCRNGDAAKDLAAELGMDATRPVLSWRPEPGRAVERVPARPDDDKEPAQKRAWARDIWRRAEPAAGTVVERYLRSRGITIPVPPSLRIGWLTHQATGKERKWPAMVGAMQVLDGLVGVHRTYLDPDGGGKARIRTIYARRGEADSVANIKLMLGSAAGAVVRLSPLTPSLIIAEGIESALSVLQMAPGWTVWAGLSAGNLAEIAIPSIVQRLVYVADGDRKADYRTLGIRRVGQHAAQRAADAHAGRGLFTRVVVPTPNDDPNDILMADPALARELAAMLAGWLAMPVRTTDRAA